MVEIKTMTGSIPVRVCLVTIVRTISIEQWNRDTTLNVRPDPYKWHGRVRTEREFLLFFCGLEARTCLDALND